MTTLRAAAVFVLGTMMLVLAPTLAQAVTVTVNPVDYVGAWRVAADGAFRNGQQVLDLTPGTHTVILGDGPSTFDFDLDATGLVTPAASAPATGGANVLTFDNVTISVDVGGYDGTWRFGPSFWTGNRSLTVVPNLLQQIALDTWASFFLQADGLGNVLVAEVATDPLAASIPAAVGAAGVLTFQTRPIAVDVGGYEGGWRFAGGAWRSGNSTVTVVKTAPAAITLGQWATFFVESNAADQVLVADLIGDPRVTDIPAARVIGAGLFFKSVSVFVAAGRYEEFWSLAASGLFNDFRSGSQSFTLVPSKRFELAFGVGLPGGFTGSFFLEASAHGEVKVAARPADPGVEDILAASAAPYTVKLKTVSVKVEPSDALAQWTVAPAILPQANIRIGTQFIGLVPTLSYQVAAFSPTPDSGTITVSDPCAVSPSSVTLDSTTLQFSCADPAPGVYHVDSIAGDDANDGSLATPWRTLAKVNATALVPGDTVLLRRGSVFRERLIVDEDGTAAAPITIDAYGDGPAPVISAGQLIGQGAPWTDDDGDGEFRLVLGPLNQFYTSIPSLVRADPTGIESYILLARDFDGPLAPDTYHTQIESIESGAGRVLYYRPPDPGSTPDGYEFEVSKRNTAILALGDYVGVRNVSAILGNIGHGMLDAPANLATVNAVGAGFTLRDCTVAFGRAFGIMVFGPDSLVDGCTAEHNHSTGIAIQLTAATGSVVQNSIARFNGNIETDDQDRGGIATQSSNTIIRDNVIHDNGNINDNTAPRIAGDGAIALFEAHDVLVEGNFIYNSARAAIWASRGPQSYGQRIIGNVIYNWNLVGPICDPAPGEPPGDCQNASAARSAIALFGFDNPYTAGLFDIHNNTIYSDQADVWIYGIQLGLSFNTDLLRDSSVLNNIVHMPNNTDPRSVGLRATRSELYDVDVEIDYNDIYMPLTPGPNNYATTTHGIGPDIGDLGEPEYEVNSLHRDPELNLDIANPVDPVRFDLLPGSPVQDVGIDVGLAEDFLGRPVPFGLAPDMGAFEAQSGCVDTDQDGVCDDVDACPGGPLVVDGFQAPLGPLVLEGEAPLFPDKAFKANRTLPLKLVLSCNGGPLDDLDVPPPLISELVRDGDALNLTVIDTDAGESNDGGQAFRFDDGKWVYNLSTKGLEPGSYVISVLTPENESRTAAFVLK